MLVQLLAREPGVAMGLAAFGLQGISLVESPGHSAPPNLGTGLVQVRSKGMTLSPHSPEHCPAWDQAVHFPSTAGVLLDIKKTFLCSVSYFVCQRHSWLLGKKDREWLFR